MDTMLSAPLSEKTINILVAAGYETKEKLDAASPVDLLKLPGLGRSCLNEIKEYLGGGLQADGEAKIKDAITLLQSNGYLVTKPPVIEELKKRLDGLHHSADYSDIGSVVGMVIFGHKSGAMGFDVEDFLSGFEHGLSIAGNTHG